MGTWDVVNWMDRAEMVELLEAHGFAVYDTETDQELRTAIVANVEDGTFTLEDLTQ